MEEIVDLNQLAIGEIFLFNEEKHVLLDKTYEEWYNSGGMGEYSFVITPLKSMISEGDFKDKENPKWQQIHLAERQLRGQRFKRVTDEAPFEINKRQATLYSSRRKIAKTITVYE